MKRFRAMLLAGLAGLVLVPGVRADITIQFDYTYDAGFFTSHPEAKATLEAAADSLAVFADDLAAIVPGGGNWWEAGFYRPDTGALDWLSNPVIPADTLIIYAGGRNLGGSLGIAGPGWWSAGDTWPWIYTVKARGETGALDDPATDVGPWGGSVAFTTASNIDWYFGLDAAGLGAGQYDFLSVATHELAHVLGFGTADSWDTCISGGVFTGPAAVAEYGSNVPLDGILQHWVSGTMSEVDGTPQEAAMDPELTQGTRKRFTDLDFAGLVDVGWEVPVSEYVWSGAVGTAWSVAGNWSPAGPPATGTTAVFDAGSAHQPAMNQAAGVQRIEFRSAGWTVAGPGTLTVHGGGGASLVAGVNTVTAPVAMDAAGTWTVAAGGTLALTDGFNAGGFDLAKDGAGVLQLADPANLGALDIQAGTLRLTDLGTLVMESANLQIADAAALDLTDNNLVVDYVGNGPFGGIEDWVASGYSGGSWDGPGIASSAADATLHALGVLDTALDTPPAAVDGEALDDLIGAGDTGAVIVKFTYYGDADLDGQVTIGDLDLLAYGWENQVSQGGGEQPRWAIGDFDYSGQMTISDLDLLANAWENQGGALPEPATLALVGLGAVAMLGWRRRSR